MRKRIIIHSPVSLRRRYVKKLEFAIISSHGGNQSETIVGDDRQLRHANTKSRREQQKF